MRKPERRGFPINSERYSHWVNEFSGFRHEITEDDIRNWLDQFRIPDRDIAARLLDYVIFINAEQIRQAFKEILNGLPGWHRTETKRVGKWRFVPYSSSAGESGDSMLHTFRHANNLASRAFNNLFIYPSNIVLSRLSADDTVVLVDDMIGSGKQACTSWDSIFGELLAEVGQVYFVVVTACDSAVKMISSATEMVVRPHFKLHDSDNFFHNSCKHFNRDEKDKILAYCTKVDSKDPRGFGKCGLTVVLSHTIPNNTLPIFGKTARTWSPLFRRYD